MPDISKCEGKDCPIRKKCYRYTSPDSIHQSYNNYEYNHETENCPDFWNRETGENGYTRRKEIPIERVTGALEGIRFDLQNEKILQDQIKQAFDMDELPCSREYKLGDLGTIDFMAGDIGIEVKIKGKLSKRAIYRQLERYADSAEINKLLLVTSISMGLPKEIKGKPCYYLNLSKAWL